MAGYNIAKGKLTTVLHYRIENRQLDAQHNIRIDQLEWGEATESQGEATLPVKFATSLLKDRDGVINLDVPVGGTLDDPTFRIGPIVWQVIKNIIVKAVTAPFALLGSLFEGAEEAQFVDFAPGEASLDPTTAGRLAALAKSLAEKPQLKLDVPIGVVAELDRPALAERAYQAALAGGRRGRSKDAPTEPGPAFETLEPQAADRGAVGAGHASRPAPSRRSRNRPRRPRAPPRAEAKALREAAALEFLTAGRASQRGRARKCARAPRRGARHSHRARAARRGRARADARVQGSRRQGRDGSGPVRFELGLQ